MDFFVYDTYNNHNFFHKVTDSFLGSFNTKMKILLKKIIKNKINTKKITTTEIKNTQEYKNFSPFLCNSISKCPCDYKSVILSNEQMRTFLSHIDVQYDRASGKGNVGLALLIEAKFKNLRGTSDFNYLYSINDAGSIANFSSAVVNIKVRHNEKKPETQTKNDFFNGVINSINNNDTIHYIVNESLFPKYNSPDYSNFLGLYRRKKNTTPGYCSIKKRLNWNCELFKKIGLIMKF
jgi:hypothetical protein